MGKKEVLTRFQEKMEITTNEVYKTSITHKVTLLVAAYIVVLDRLKKKNSLVNNLLTVEIEGSTVELCLRNI